MFFFLSPCIEQKLLLLRLFSVSFLTSDGLSDEENSSFWYDFMRVVVTKKNSFAFVQKQRRFLNCKTALFALLSFPGFFPSKDPVVFARFDDAG